MKKNTLDKLSYHEKLSYNSEHERYLYPYQVMKIEDVESDIETQELIQNYQQFLYGRLAVILHPIISKDTLSLYMRNLQLYSTLLKCKQQSTSKDGYIKQNFINRIESLQKSIQQSQHQIQQLTNAILKSNQQYANITNTIQQILLPKITNHQFLDQHQHNYPQLIRICINELNSKQKSANVKSLRLQRQLSQLTLKIKQNKKISTYKEHQKQMKLQDINRVKYQNQVLIQKRKEMDNIINILKDKNKQLTLEAKKLRGMCYLSNSKHAYSQYSQNNDHSQNLVNSVDHNRSVYKSKGHTRNNSAENNFKSIYKQQLSSQVIFDQNKIQKKKIYNQTQNKNYKQIIEEQSKLIKLLKQQLNNVNQIKSKQIDIIDKGTLNKIQQFKKQVNLILQQSQSKIKHLQKQLQYKQKMIQYSEIKISKIIKILRGRQLHEILKTNDIVCNLQDIFQILNRNTIITNNQKSQYTISHNHLKMPQLQDHQSETQQYQQQRKVNYQNINNQKHKLSIIFKPRQRSLSQQKKQNERMLNCIAQCPDEQQLTDEKQTKSITITKYQHLNSSKYNN